LIRSGSASDFRASLSPVSELAIDLDRNGGGAPHRQIQASIRERIRSGAVPADVARPPALALAAELSVARGVVIEAYAQLVAEGYLTSRSGGVHRWRPRRPPRRRPPHPRPGRPGCPVALASPRGRLRLQPLQPRRLPAGRLAALGAPRSEAADKRLGYFDGRGAVELRSATAAYLNRVRGDQRRS
jgi:GntR family transcriptional regulator/MocR family aminotransferase